MIGSGNTRRDPVRGSHAVSIHSAVFIGLLVAATAAASALAQQGPVQFRWASGFAQGTVEAIIRTADDSYVAFACPGGQMDPAPSVSVQVRGRTPGGQTTLQIVVDGRNYPLSLNDGFSLGRGRSAEAAVVNAAHALVRSNSRTFVAEIPEIGWRQQFSLANSRDALGARPGRTIVDGCLR